MPLHAMPTFTMTITGMQLNSPLNFGLYAYLHSCQSVTDPIINLYMNQNVLLVASKYQYYYAAHVQLHKFYLSICHANVHFHEKHTILSIINPSFQVLRTHFGHNIK